MDGPESTPSLDELERLEERLTISVVIPSRNDAPVLIAILAALAAQTRLADEILVVDHRSGSSNSNAWHPSTKNGISLPGTGISTDPGP